MVRILALDVGRKRVGVALSDPLGVTAQAAGFIDRWPESSLFGSIRSRAREAGAETVLMGFPLTLRGEAGDAAKEVAALAERLKEAVGLPVVLWDERLSTAQAEKILLASDLSRRKRRAVVDGVAAALILQSYLDATR